MIKPEVGRVVHVYNRPGAIFPGRPESAQIAYVHGDHMINVGGIDHNGVPFSATSVQLIQGDEKPYMHFWAEWMPYQKGQAAKTEELERKLADKSV